MSFLHETDVAIIGAGPAGLSAALAAKGAGANVTVIDEYPQPGGQFYRQLASGVHRCATARACLTTTPRATRCSRA